MKIEDNKLKFRCFLNRGQLLSVVDYQSPQCLNYLQQLAKTLNVLPAMVGHWSGRQMDSNLKLKY